MRNERKPIKSLTAVTCWLAAGALVLWLVSIAAVTLVSANHYLLLFSESASKINEYASNWINNNLQRHRADIPGRMDSDLWESIQVINASSWDDIRITEKHSSHYEDEDVYRQTAVVITDPENNVLAQSGDFLYFDYVTKDIWDADLEETTTTGFAIMHIDEATWNEQGQVLLNNTSLYGDARAMRLTGVLNGTQLIPQKVEYISYETFEAAVRSTPPTYSDATSQSWSYTVSEIIREQQVPWITVYEQAEPLAGEIVTLYTTHPTLNLYDEGGPVRHQEEQYDSLLTLLYEAVTEWEDVYPLLTQRSIWDVTLSYSDRIYDSTIEDYRYTVYTAIHVSPMENAVRSLWKIYLLTFLCFVSVTCYLRYLLRCRLTEPVSQVLLGIQNNWRELYPTLDEPPHWREIRELGEEYRNNRNRLYRYRMEEARLNTALAYAREAEDNRRQMTSAIAHELKTPLAVIHSYTEGLQEHINEEKREQYLQVILSEVQRMDGMVLEMLDLSRLEAGKVKLAQDNFSLCDLTRNTFDRLKLAVEAKELKVTFDFRCDGQVTADEARIGQVLTNFITNAIKYTVPGGYITVRIRPAGEKIRFSIENQCPALSREALSRLWDTFYRADTSRSGEGTGLGLAISKSIIELHGGACAVQNTLNGVEFRFTL